MGKRSAEMGSMVQATLNAVASVLMSQVEKFLCLHRRAWVVVNPKFRDHGASDYRQNGRQYLGDKRIRFINGARLKATEVVAVRVCPGRGRHIA